jgi:hypothetical protein
VTQPNRYDYVAGAIGTGLGLAITAAAGAFLLVSLPRPTETEQRREARVLILAVGGLLGAALIVFGVWFFYRWSDSLVKWLDKGDWKEARWALYPLLMMAFGSACMFVAIQPARAEERNDPTIRRLVYGSNFGLTVLMLFVVLVIANAIVAMRLPNKLDTTRTGFYSLSPQTQQFLEGLEQPVHAYAILQDTGSAVTEDTKRLLTKAQDANPSKFRVTFLSPALNRTDIAKLKADFPMAEMSREGVLIVAGDEGGADRKRHAFIRADEFGDQKEELDGRTVPTFNGEPKLLRELMFLAENKQRPKIYFTQSSGELALAPGGRGAEPRRTATALKGYLERNYFDVAELTFDVGAPAKVPDDAAVVVVADPTSPLPPNAVDAIRKFMSEPRPDGKKGKLVVLAGAQPGTDERPLKFGLDPLLATFGVQLSDRFMYTMPSERADPRDADLGTRVTYAVINPEAVEARNPVALGFTKVDRLPLLDSREVTATPVGPPLQALTVLTSMPGRTTWSEATYLRNPFKAWTDFTEKIQAIFDGPGAREQKEKQAEELAATKQITRRTRGLAVFVSEGGTARVAVFGNGWFVSDDASAQANAATRGQAVTLWLDLMGSTLDWIRDRPTVVGVTEKPYSTYTLKPGFDVIRLNYLPLGLAFIVVIGLGAGVWVVRRR